MATIGLAHTFADMQRTLNAQGAIGEVIEILSQVNPIMEDITWKEGDLPIGNKTLIRASLPTPGIRRVNRGISPTKGTTKAIIDVCMSLEDRSEIDTKLLKGKPNPEAYRSIEDKAHVEGMGQYVAAMLMYGDLAGEPDTINGLVTRYNSLAGDKGSAGYQVVSAGTANAGAKNTSVVMVDWGDNRVTGIYPRNTMAGLHTEDLGIYDAFDRDNKRFRAVGTLYTWDFGLAVENVRSVARLANIDATKLDTMSSADKLALVNQFIKAKNRIWQPKKPVAYVSDSMYTFFETYLVDKNNVHVTRQELMGEAPKLYVSGIQLKKMDCMADTESAVQ